MSPTDQSEEFFTESVCDTFVGETNLYTQEGKNNLNHNVINDQIKRYYF